MVFIHILPVDYLAERVFLYHVEPDVGRTAIALHERMTHVHLDILLYDVLKSVFWHLFYGSEGCIKIKTIGKAETALGYILIADDTITDNDISAEDLL